MPNRHLLTNLQLALMCNCSNCRSNCIVGVALRRSSEKLLAGCDSRNSRVLAKMIVIACLKVYKIRTVVNQCDLLQLQ